MRIAVDFDGTIAAWTEHPASGMFPLVAATAVPGAFEWMRKWQKAGAELILWTMRSGGKGDKFSLDDAVEFCRENGVEFYGVNHGPGDSRWTQSPKVYAHVYVDDAAFGCPLIDFGKRPCADWSIIGPTIMERLEK